jgi:hypothetical protein
VQQGGQPQLLPQQVQQPGSQHQQAGRQQAAAKPAACRAAGSRLQAASRITARSHHRSQAGSTHSPSYSCTAGEDGDVVGGACPPVVLVRRLCPSGAPDPPGGEVRVRRGGVPSGGAVF